MKKYLYFTISVLTFLIGMVFLFGYGDMEQSAISVLTAIVFLNKCDIEELKEGLDSEIKVEFEFESNDEFVLSLTDEEIKDSFN